MTRALADAAWSIKVVDAPKLTEHAICTVFAAMARIAQEDGSFRWGLSIRKVADMTKLSTSTVERAQRWLRRSGFLEIVKAGGGRAANVYRVVVEKLFPPPATAPEDPEELTPGRPCPATGTAQTRDRDGGQGHDPGSQGFSPPNPRAAGEPPPPASRPPAAAGPRCRHRRTSCRACGTSPRQRARAARLADIRTARACRMCVAVPTSSGTYWVRAIPGTQTALSPDQPCDHATSTEQHTVQHSEPGSGVVDAARAQIRAMLSSTPRRPSRATWRTPERTP